MESVDNRNYSNPELHAFGQGQKLCLETAWQNELPFYKSKRNERHGARWCTSRIKT